MAEAIGVTASLIGIIQLAAQATKLTYEYVSGVKRAPENLQKFGNELKSLTQVLKTVQEYAITNSESKALCKLNDPGQPLQICMEELAELLRKLEFNLKEIKRWKRMLNRLKWPLKEKETSDFLQQIERWKSSFLLALALDQAASRNAEILKRDTIRNEGKRDEILNWLYRETYDKRHVEISGRRQAGTGHWILREPEVQEWTKPQSSRTLWGYGIPGAGKTFLTSLVIDHLHELTQTENYGLAYIYFNFKEQEQQMPIDVFSSLVKQLFCQIGNLPKELEDLYDRLRSKQKRPTMEELYAALLVAIKSFTKTFIVCDALDECDPKTQRRILLPLFNRMEKDGVSLFLTSREYPEDIQQSLEGSAKVKLWAKDEDISTYIEQKIAENSRAQRLIGNGDYRDKIITQLKQCANGMFLLVHFHIEFLCQQTTLRRILAELEKLKRSAIEAATSDPTSNRALDPTYDRAMRILRSQPESCVELASKVILWLVKSQRTLTVLELQMAVSVEQESTIFDEMELPDRKTLLDVCASLVTVDDTDTVRLAHYTVQEYILKNSIVPHGGFEIAMACTTFLSFDVFVHPCASADSLRDRYKTYPFYGYATQYLYFHVKECREKEELLAELLLRFLGNSGNRSSFLQGYLAGRGRERLCHEYCDDRTPLHVAAIMGHAPTIRLLLEKGADIFAKDKDKMTAILYATRSGNESIVELLLENGADINSNINGSVLHLAATKDDEPLARLLLKKGADISITDDMGWTALHEAAGRDCEPIVRLFLENGADVSATGYRGDTALHRAAGNGNESIAQLLLDYGADTSAVLRNGKTPLHRAAFTGRVAVARLLLKNGADISAVDKNGSTALHDALARRHEPVARLLLEMGADISATTTDGDTMLHRAASNGDAPMAKLLLEKGADISAVTSDGKTVLHKALSSYNNPEAVIQLLIDNGVDIAAATSDGNTALHRAACIGDESVVWLLIKEGANISAVTRNGYTALHMAVSNGREPVVRLLLEKGADISATTDDGETVLHRAACNGSVPMVRLLLESGADISAITNDGKTVLHSALAFGGDSEPMIRLLLTKGADISASTDSGNTVLHKAAGNGTESLCRLLLGNGANASAVNMNGWDALHMAALNGNEPVVRLLLEKSTGNFATTKGGETALHMAAINGSEPVVRLLLEKGADRLAVTSCGETPLHMAAFNGSESMIRLLLGKGSGISAVTMDGATALHFAVLGGRESVVRLLLDKGVDPLAVTNIGDTALHYAVSNPNPKSNPVPIVKLLLEKGVNPLSVTEDGRTLLHSAALGGDASLFQLFLEKGLDLSTVTTDGKTLLHIAASGGKEFMVRMLINQGLNPSSVTKGGKTALHCAASHPDPLWRDSGPVVQLLLEKGANISAVTNDGQTALQMAISQGHDQITHILNCAFDGKTF